jgi:hypothetical protein
MSLQKNQAIFAQNVSKLINFLFDSGFSCSLGEVYRTAEQAEIYAKESKGIVNSLHCKKLAIDINLFDLNGVYLVDPASYLKLAEYWESLNPKNRSGIRFKRVDSNHFEMTE